MSAPVANPDFVLAAENGVPIDFNVLANDLGAGLLLVGVDAAGLQGEVVWGANGLVTYDPAEAFQSLAVGQSADTTFTSTWALTYVCAGDCGALEACEVTYTLDGERD